MSDIFTYAFMQRAFAAGMIIAVIAPSIGMFLTVRRYSLIADTLAHVALAGIAVSALLQSQPVFTAAVVSALAAIVIERMRSAGRFSGESLLALFLSGSLAVAVVIMSATKSLNTSLINYLFGSITTVSQMDLVVISLLGAAVLAIVLLCYRALFLVSFDEEVASAQGAPSRALNTLLAVLTAITISVSMRIVGVLLVGALMVIPVLAAMNLGRGFKNTTVFAVVFSLASVVLGLFVSYWFDLASGGTIVLISIGFFLITLFLRRT
jgi:zinc transport system permease protein